jgi:cell wall-associated NlpC family hydrolase
MNEMLTMISGNSGDKKQIPNSYDKNYNDGDKMKITSKIEIAEAERGNYNHNQVNAMTVKSSNPNLLLFDKYSAAVSANVNATTSTTATAKNKPNKTSSEKHCIGCTPGGLTATALNMNLSSIGSLCTNVGCIGANFGGSKDANSSARVSRSASPAPGSTTENARFRYTKLKIYKIGCFFLSLIYLLVKLKLVFLCVPFCLSTLDIHVLL